MPLIRWEDSYNVDIIVIDQQHRKLVDLINGFHDAMANKKTNEFMTDLFIGLIQYTKSHFATEERYFRQYDFPGAENHQKEHQKFIEKVADMKERFDKGQLILTLEVMNFLKDWLVNHIQGTDKKYSAFFKSKGLK